MTDAPIKALVPRQKGHQFAFYGDSCSGVPGALHAQKLAKVNKVVQRFQPAPEFIIFPGDEVIGLIPDEAELREQWRYFFDVEMGWLRDTSIPIYHSTGNHTTYDRMSERVFADVMAHLPHNGPDGQAGLSYFVRRGDLLLIFVHTLWSGLGGEGHLELTWLREVLESNADARWTFVVGHHPVFPVNGYVGTYQRTIGEEYSDDFWSLLSAHGVTAYLCSHILAFDVQCYEGVLQITSGGAGTAHRMPEGFEYLHAVQMAVGEDGLRYQVFDEDGVLREGLSWPPEDQEAWHPLTAGVTPCLLAGETGAGRITQLQLSGTTMSGVARQTILAAIDDNGGCPLWIGLIGRQMQLTLIMQPERGRSPHQWHGPCFANGEVFDLELMLHGDMGPGGFLWRNAGTDTWTGFLGMSAWGAERLIWPQTLCVGRHGEGDTETVFEGALTVSISSQ